MRNILICVAMEKERELLKTLLESEFPLLKEDNDVDYFAQKVTEREFIGRIAILETGIGKLAATASLAYFLSKNKDYNVVINAGFAAGTNGKHRQGDIILPTYAIDLDFNSKGLLNEVTESMYKCYEPFHYDKLQVVATSDNFVTQDIVESRESFIKRNSVVAFDMEAAGLARLCNVFNKTFICIKCVSDIPGESNIEDFESFVKKSEHTLFNKVVEIIKRQIQY